MFYDNQVFKSEEAALVFYLTTLEGKQRNDLLGVRQVHYVDKNKATQWYDSLLAKLNNKNGVPAIKLKGIYDLMVNY